MSIDRTVFNTWADDRISGPGTGTTFGKAEIVAGLLDPIDAAIIAPGGQLLFPATQNPSANANTLDDYEEGTWTPSLGGTTTYSVQAGSYTKIGRVVTATAQLAITLIGTGSTYAISGLPFAAAQFSAGGVAYFTTLAANVVWIGCYVGTANIYFSTLTAAGASAGLTPNVFGNGTVMSVSATYTV